MAEKAAIQVRDNCPEGVAYLTPTGYRQCWRESRFMAEISEIYWTRAASGFLTYAECILAVPDATTKRT